MDKGKSSAAKWNFGLLANINPRIQSHSLSDYALWPRSRPTPFTHCDASKLPTLNVWLEINGAGSVTLFSRYFFLNKHKGDA